MSEKTTQDKITCYPMIICPACLRSKTREPDKAIGFQLTGHFLEIIRAYFSDRNYTMMLAVTRTIFGCNDQIRYHCNQIGPVITLS
jgi:hypothetical protein